MTLLRELQDSPLDPAYADARARRERRAASGARVESGWGRVGTFLLAAALGLGLTIAATTLRTPDGSTRATELLTEQIAQRRASTDALEERNAALAAEIRDLSTTQLAASDPELAEQFDALGVASAVTAVTGPALTVRLSDSARALEAPAEYPSERVQAIDLQVVVNALWAAGAEAIAVNGTRISGLGAIRSAGSAVLVDLVPVTSPYEIVAIGHSERMVNALDRSTAGAHLEVLSDRYRIQVTTDLTDSVTLDASRVIQPRYADPLGNPDDVGTSQVPATTGDVN
ncbi:uncharacterized protein YlxW (UPF0749 family) [Serinibacter salmoneus]|uniref:Uncharacterized protein YlxW (UPF0749 family) n=2 Tax=Serinibacter salmoneus TaxID=556530 RepID=A0A2A9D0A1_9MICO|nr:uncharacterized protein YlxW (UPF0749 family) [Serinibacter salmoneus]